MKTIDFKHALSERYLAYALSTIISRSLPDVRDGLKPVHRRLLFAMRELKLNPNLPPKKCARIVGNVIGKYHPHGDLSVYDALVRLAQEFTLRYPLIEGQGNFGNIDGDNAAAMRYTEARLTKVAEYMMEGLTEDAVNFRLTYDGEFNEPIVLPSAFPNLLANGASGIAVGMATSIPSHNAEELCDALLHFIKNENCNNKDLLEYVRGPDFATGGVIVDSVSTIHACYETGRGSLRVRAYYEIEQSTGGQYKIIIKEMPPYVQKSKLIERIADLMIQKKLPLLADINDESAEDIRLVLTPKSRSVDPRSLMEILFKMTDLEVRVTFNMNVVTKEQVPQVMSLRGLLKQYLNHRLEVLIRRFQYKLNQITNRLEVISGFLIVYAHLDEIIRIIRYEDNPKEKIMARWSISEMQAEAILNMRLRALHKLEEVTLKSECESLEVQKKEIQEVLSSESAQKKVISTEIKGIKQEFSKKTTLGARRTRFEEVTASLSEIPLEAMVEKEPITIILSTQGWIRALKGHIEELQDLKFKEGDKFLSSIFASTVDRMLIVGSNGRIYSILGNDIPRGRGFGDPLRHHIDLPMEEDVISLHIPSGAENKKYLVVGSHGKGFFVEEKNLLTQAKSGKQILNLSGNSKLAFFVPHTEEDHIAVIGSNRKLVVFEESEVPLMSRGQGVILQKYKDPLIKLSDIKMFALEDGLTWTTGKKNFLEKEISLWKAKRGSIGRIPPVGFPKNNKFKPDC